MRNFLTAASWLRSTEGRDTAPLDQITRFDSFELDRENRRLARDGQTVELGSRYFDALVLLVGNAGALVSKDRFMDEVWSGIPVTDEALTQCIRSLRRALGDEAASPRYIQTVPKHGYRFLVIPDGGEGGSEPSGVETESRSLPGRIAAAMTLGGGLAGAAGGLTYGFAASTGGASTVLVLAALVAALGILAGAGVGLGMASAIAWRGKVDGMIIPGAALGGMAVGALGGTLGRDGIGLLTGEDIMHVTGLAEGLLLGAAAGTAGWLALARLERRAGPMAAALTLGSAAGLLIHVLGGRLLGGSLYALQQGLGDTRLTLERIGGLLGETGFGRTADIVTCVAEGAIFVLVSTAALLLVRSR